MSKPMYLVIIYWNMQASSLFLCWYIEFYQEQVKNQEKVHETLFVCINMKQQ